MASTGYEHLPYSGESSQDRLAYQQYLEHAKRGKSALQLQAVADQLTPDLRRNWAPQSFTGVSTSVGDFDATVSYQKHPFMTEAQARRVIERAGGDNWTPIVVNGILERKKRGKKKTP